MLRTLSSLRLFFSLCALLGAAFVYQTIFNKGAPVYGSAWFAALGLLLAANIAACSLPRTGKAPLHFTLLHAGLVLIIAGAFATRFYRFEAGLPLHRGAAASVAYTPGASYKLPFSAELKDFRIEYYSEPAGRLTVEENGTARTFDAAEGAVIKTARGGIKVLRAVRDFGLTGRREVVEKSPYWNNPAVQLEITDNGTKKKIWIFLNFSGMHAQDLPFKIAYGLDRAEIKNYRSFVTLQPDNGAAVPAEIAVNKPFKLGGYTLYQTNYDPADPGYSLLTVTMDRGVWIVYLGFAIFLTGILLWLRK